MQVRELKEKAQALYARGKFLKSRQLYEAAVVRDPADVQLQLRLADCCRRLGDVQAAAHFFSNAATVLLNAGHAARAKAALKLALELKPRDPKLLAKLEEISVALRPSEAAERARTPERFGNSARALSLEIPIVVEEPEAAFDIDEDFELDLSEPPVAEGPNLVRISEHAVAVRDGAKWKVFRAATVIREEELTDEELQLRLLSR